MKEMQKGTFENTCAFLVSENKSAYLVFSLDFPNTRRRFVFSWYLHARFPTVAVFPLGSVSAHLQKKMPPASHLHQNMRLRRYMQKNRVRLKKTMYANFQKSKN